jgi:hypothetical protein
VSRDRRYNAYDRSFFGERAGRVVLAALSTLHTLVGAPSPPRRRFDAPEWLEEQDEADQRRCCLLLDRMSTAEHLLRALLEYMPGGRVAGEWGQPEAYAMGIVGALAHHTPQALSDCAPLMRRLVSLIEVAHGDGGAAAGSRTGSTAGAGAALRCVGVGGLCQSRCAINRLLVEGSRPHPPVYVLQTLIRFIGGNRSSLEGVRCGYTHRWDSPSFLQPPGIAPQDERQDEFGNDGLRGEGPEGEWQWLTNRVWNEDDEFAASPVVVALCATLAIGWSEPRILLQLLNIAGQKQPARPREAAVAAGPSTAASRHTHHTGGYERDPSTGREVYHAKSDSDGKHGKRHGGGGYSAGGSDSATVLKGKLSYKVEPRLLQQLWSAIHHERTLFGKPCRNVRTFFNAADRDGSGALTRKELSAAMVRLDLGLSPVQLDRMLSTIDAQQGGPKDGLIEHDEFARWLHGRLGHPKPAAAAAPAKQHEYSGRVQTTPAVAAAVEQPVRPVAAAVPFRVPSSLHVLLGVLQQAGNSQSDLVCLGVSRILALMLSMATGTATGLLGLQGADRFWVAGWKSPLWTLLEVLNLAARLPEDYAAADQQPHPAAAAAAAAAADSESTETAGGSTTQAKGNGPAASGSGSTAAAGGAAHRWVVQVVWMWMRDVVVAAHSAEQQQRHHQDQEQDQQHQRQQQRQHQQHQQRQQHAVEFVYGMAAVEAVLDYLVRRSEGRSVNVASALAVATYSERRMLLQQQGGSAAAAATAAVRREVDQREAWRIHQIELEQQAAGGESLGGGTSGASGMLIGLARQSAACYKTCGGLLPWVEYAGQHDGRGRRPPHNVVAGCRAAIQRADLIWLASNQCLRMHLLEGEAEAKLIVRWRRRALTWLEAAQR